MLDIWEFQKYENEVCAFAASKKSEAFIPAKVDKIFLDYKQCQMEKSQVFCKPPLCPASASTII
jgi:hypothetical protein